MAIESDFIISYLNDALSMNHCNFSSFTYLVIDLCKKRIFDRLQSIEIELKLNRLIELKMFNQNGDHPSIAGIIKSVGNSIKQTSYAGLALPFFLEQLRIEKRYLGCKHPDLAHVLLDIGQVFEEDNDLVEAKKYFMEALSLLNNGQRKGCLYASLMYNIGLINYRQSFYNDALECFDKAIAEHQEAYGEYNISIAEIRMQVGNFQLEIGKLQNAMINFVEALTIMRMTFGNNHSTVAECYLGIGLVHEARLEYKDSFNILYQAFTVLERTQDDYDDDLLLEIKHRIVIACESMEEKDKSADVMEIMSNILKYDVLGDDAEDEVFRVFGFDMSELSPQVAAAA